MWILSILLDYNVGLIQLSISMLILLLIGIVNDLVFSAVIGTTDRSLLLLLFITKKWSWANKKIKSIRLYFSLPSPLDQESHLISEEYKNTLVKKLNEYFSISGNSYELFRLSKQMCKENDGTLSTKYNKRFNLLKGLIVALVILVVKTFLLSQYTLSSLLIIIAIHVYLEIGDTTKQSLIDNLEKAYLLVLNKKKLQQNAQPR